MVTALPPPPVRAITADERARLETALALSDLRSRQDALEDRQFRAEQAAADERVRQASEDLYRDR